MKKLEINIPFYNNIDGLRMALNNLAKSACDNFSITIKDDCGPENFYAEIIKHPLKPNYLKNQRNIGAIKNMISCLFLEQATDYVMCHHDDDLLDSSYLEKAIYLLDINPDISFVICRARTESRPKTNSNDNFKINYSLYDKNSFVKFCAEDNNFAFGSAIFRRKALRKNQIELEKYEEMFDRPFLINILTTNNSLAALIEEPLYIYHHHSYPDGRWKNLRLQHITNLYLLYKQRYQKSKILARYFFDFSNLEKKSLKNYLDFIKSLDKLKIRLSVPRKKSIFFIGAAIFITIFGKKKYDGLFKQIKGI